MKKSILIPIVIGLIVAVMLWVAVRQAHKSSPAAQLQALGSEAKGKQAPDFDLKTLDGKDVKLSSLKGQGVLVNFWATYCTPCKVEMPWLEELQKQYAGQGFTVVGVAMDDAAPEDISKFAKDMGVTYPIVLGTDAVGDSYGASFLPTSVYVGRDGKVVDRVYGLVNRKDIESNIQKTLAMGDAPAETVAQHR